MNSKNKPMFNPEKFKQETSDVIEAWMKKVPDEWKADMASFISLEAVIFGASNTYEGIGILETNKLEYLDLCNEILEDEELPGTSLN